MSMLTLCEMQRWLGRRSEPQETALPCGSFSVNEGLGQQVDSGTYDCGASEMGRAVTTSASREKETRMLMVMTADTEKDRRARHD